ncbi:MAG: GNAT family N-acetyltransferase [Candidatus Acidiferrum sp.]
MSKKGNELGLRIRRARPGDAPAIAELSGQLGYPTTVTEVTRRMRKLKTGARNALFVADAGEAGVVGWTHISITHLIEVRTRAELNGLIVAEKHRSLGAGAKLLEAAEDWARKQRCAGMSVRSNVLRDRAHKFYERQGYEHYKTQKAFRKAL